MPAAVREFAASRYKQAIARNDCGNGMRPITAALFSTKRDNRYSDLVAAIVYEEPVIIQTRQNVRCSDICAVAKDLTLLVFQ